MRKIAVVLSGCGHREGTEITEAVSTLIALSEAGATYACFAPNVSVPETDRNVLVESGKISRGQIKDVALLQSKDFDGVVFPGGFGAANVLCNFGKAGSKATVLPEIKRVIENFYEDAKPIGAMCIAPALLALVLGRHFITFTVGERSEVSEELSKTGAIHEVCRVTDYVTDRENKIVTTPAYMYDNAKPFEVFKGIRGAIQELVEMS